MIGIYVDDYLTVGQPQTVEKFLSYLRRLWNTSDPQYLSQSSELPFLGFDNSEIPEWAISTPGSVCRTPPRRARLTHPEKGQNNHRGRKFQGGTKPSTTTRHEQSRAPVMDQAGARNYWSATLVVNPDAARPVHVLFRWRPRHCSRTSRSSRIDLGIYSSTLSQRKSWVFPIHSRKGHPTSFSLTEFTVYTDSSFAPASKQSQTGIAKFLTCGTVRHLNPLAIPERKEDGREFGRE